ncbi:MAG: class I SAM-dependent methyltransferase [Magnetococcales bacterium]|nr:class I SAM-dependent methyltransferase [Magnetococcales bacterium]
MNDWWKIWGSRQRSLISGSPLAQLIAADGFDEVSQLGEQAWMDHVTRIQQRLGILPGDSLFEVGCGAGAFLYPLHLSGCVVAGIDYSEPLLAMAQQAIPTGSFTFGTAAELSQSPQYDVVLSNSVFFYFSNLEYAAAVLERMLRKARNAVAVLDVPDAATQRECLAFRQEKLGAHYAESYRHLDHLYFDRSWFQDVAARVDSSFRCSCADQAISGYAYNRFRFNVMLTKSRG